MAEAWAWPLGLAVLGLVVGSFLAALVVRWPEGRSIVHGRSGCDACGRPLRAWELVPLASGLLLHGRCAGCARPIDPVHWRIEAGAALIGASAGIAVAGPAALAGAAFAWLLLALAALDVAAFWLPDRLTVPLLLAGIALGLPATIAERATGAVAGFALLWAVMVGYRWLRGREGLGGGDPKLLAAIGAWLGWRMIPAVLLVAALTGLALVLVDRLRGRPVARDTAVPFGALMAVAAYPAWLAMVGWPA